MVDQMEFIYQGIENARNQYQQQQHQHHQQQQLPQPQFNEEASTTAFPSPTNASDFSHHGSSFHPLELQFRQRADLLNHHFFQFPQQHAKFVSINTTTCHQQAQPDLSAQLLLQQQMQLQQQQQLSPQLSSQQLSPPQQLQPPQLQQQQQLLPPMPHHQMLTQHLMMQQPEPSAQSANKANEDTTKRDKKRKSKRVRTTFTPEQLARLEAEFADQGYLVGEYRNYLAKALHLSECQVKVWFQNRRIKKRKLEKQAKKEQ